MGEQSGSPFTQRIVDAPPSKKFSSPKFTVYNGRTDPVDHVYYNQQVMAYWFLDDVVMCRMFPTILGDVALKWFTRLPAGKIDSFRELAELFMARFITNSRIVKGPEALTNLRKKKYETLQEYSSRYWEVFQEMEDCDMKFSLNTFKYGLHRTSMESTIP